MKKVFSISDDNVVLVTGAAGGLGSCFVRQLRDKKATVIATDSVKTDDNMVDEVLDVTDYKQCLKLAEKYSPNIWINNAGILGAGLIENIDMSLVEKVIQVNLIGVINGTKAAIEVMKKKGGGSILNIGSLASYSPTYGIGIYSASKFGVRGFTHTTAQEVKKHNIFLSLLCPDGVWTPMLQAEVNNADAKMPFSSGKLLEPEIVVKAGIELIESKSLTKSLPLYRALLARLSGEVPNLVSNLAKMTSDIGSKTQAKYKNYLN